MIPSTKNWKIFIPQDKDVLIQDIDLFRDFAVAVEKSQALNRMRIFDFKSGTWRAISFPEPVYSAVPGDTPELHVNHVSLQLSKPGHTSHRL